MTQFIQLTVYGLADGAILALAALGFVLIYKASGVFNMGRFLGGMFGIALLVATFSANGATDSPANFSAGFTAATTVAAALSLLGAVAGVWLPARHRVAASQVPRSA